MRLIWVVLKWMVLLMTSQIFSSYNHIKTFPHNLSSLSEIISAREKYLWPNFAVKIFTGNYKINCKVA